MKSLKKRFKEQGRAKEVLDYTKRWGIHKAMDEFGVRDYIAMKKYLKEATGNENFGVSPRFNGGGKTDIFEVVRAKLEDYVAKVNQRNTTLTAELERLRGENEVLRREMYDAIGNKLLAIVDTLETE